MNSTYGLIYRVEKLKQNPVERVQENVKPLRGCTGRDSKIELGGFSSSACHEPAAGVATHHCSGLVPKEPRRGSLPTTCLALVGDFFPTVGRCNALRTYGRLRPRSWLELAARSPSARLVGCWKFSRHPSGDPRVPWYCSPNGICPRTGDRSKA